MKDLKEFIKEEIGLGCPFATPANTNGIGNPSAPTDTQSGSGDIPQPLCVDIKTGKLYKRRKKFKRYKI